MPRPERCCRCVETLRYATARSMSKGHTTVCPLVVALTRATLLLFSCCSSTKISASLSLRGAEPAREALLSEGRRWGLAPSLWPQEAFVMACEARHREF